MLYSTGFVNVFANFWRTVWNTFTAPSDASQFKYGYGYGDNGYGYWYGYWYGYGSYSAGYVNNSSNNTWNGSTWNSWSWGGGSYHWGWWGGGSSSSYTNTNNNVNNNTTSNRLNLVKAKNFINKVVFTTPKFKRLIPKLNKLVEKEFAKAYFVTSQSVFENLVNEYYEFEKTLKDYESKKITIVQLREKAKTFLIAYNQYKTAFNEAVSVKIEYVKWVKVKNYVFKKCKIQKTITLLDKLIKKELSKPKYTKENIKNFYKSYNMFKLAVKYMKSVNKVEGKKYVKMYAVEMLQVLKK